MANGDIMSAYESEFGVTIHRLVSTQNDLAVIDVKLYVPGDEDFQWALKVAKEFSND